MTDQVTVYQIDQQQTTNKTLVVDNGKNLDERYVLAQIGQLMSNQQFRLFFQTYFHDWTEIKMIIMCMKMYELVDQYHQQQRVILSASEILTIVRETLLNQETRGVLIGEMQKFSSGLESYFDFQKLEGGKYLPIMKQKFKK